jgi:hypothetical protein
MRDYRKNILYSQNGEEGILIEAFKRMGIKSGTCVEFGAHDGSYCSNTRYFLENGWKGLLIEADPTHSTALEAIAARLDVKLLTGTFVTPDNVNDLLPAKGDLLSIDCDGPDYSIWAAYKGAAKVVVIEINSSYPPDSNMLMLAGTAYKPMVELGISKGYFLIAHTGNCIFVQDKYRHLFPEAIGDGLTNADEYFDKAFL